MSIRVVIGARSFLINALRSTVIGRCLKGVMIKSERFVSFRSSELMSFGRGEVECWCIVED
jgi:hypothetical protein